MSDVDRRKALEKRLWAAIEADGHPDGVEMVHAVAECEPARENCVALRDRVQRISNAAAVGGVALDSLDRDLDRAEKAIKIVEGYAITDGPQRKRLLKQKADQLAASDLCEHDVAPCKKGCDENVGAKCVVLGVMLTNEKKFDEAKAAYKKACDGGADTGCTLLKELDGKQAQATAAIDNAWAAVVQAGDEIAVKRFLMAYAARKFSGTKNAQATKRMGEHIAALTKESYCPAMRDFIAMSSASEFTTRAKAHCDDSPPTSIGESGTDERCTAECRVTFMTTGCP